MSEVKRAEAPNVKVVRQWKKPRANPSRFTPACRLIYTALPKDKRPYLSPLLHYASERGLKPEEIDNAAIDAYREQLARWGVEDAASFIASLVRDWNSLQGQGAFAGLTPLISPVGKREQDRARRLALLSPSVMAELDKIHDGRLRTPNSPEHASYNRRKRFERLIEAAVEEGATINQIADLTGPGVLRKAVNRLYPRIKKATKSRDIILTDLERFFRDASMASQAAEVGRVRCQYPRAGLGIAPGSAARIATFSRSDMLAIVADAIKVVAELKPGSSGRKAIACGRAAIAILLVIFNTCPRGTIEAARFGGEPEGRRRPSLLGPHGNAESINLETNLPPAAIAALDHYYATVASWIGQAPRTLFDVPKDETPRSGSALSTGVRRLLEKFGYPEFTLQLLRDGVNAAFLAAKDDDQLSGANGYAFDANFQYRYAALKGSDIAAQIEASFAGRTIADSGSAS